MLIAYDTLLQTSVSAVQALADDEKHFRYECLCCGEEVFLAAQGSAYKATHFRHKSGNNDKKCELYLSKYGSIYVSSKSRHNKHERLDFYFDNKYKYFCGLLCFNEDELKSYEENNTEFEIRSERNTSPFFSTKIDRQHFCENIPEPFIIDKYATPYYISNTLNNRKREYFLFEDNAPTFFKIQGENEDYKAKYVKSKYIYTNVRYFVAWVGCNAAQIKLNSKQAVVIEDQFEFVTMGNLRVWGMIVTFKGKTPELDELLQTWGYNLSISEDLLLLWPPAYNSDDTNYISQNNAFVYSTFNIQHGNTNIQNKYIHHISSNVSAIEFNEVIKIIKKNAELSIELDKKTIKQNSLITSTVYERSFIIPNDGSYYQFTDDGVERLNEGQKIILTPKTVVVEYKHNYPVKRIFYKEKTKTTLEDRIEDALSNYWVCEKYCSDTTEKYFESRVISDYLLCCKQKESINSAILKILRENKDV